MSDFVAILIARIVSALSTVLIGSFLQIFLWRNKTSTIVGALFHYPILWMLYLLIGLLIGEHIIRLLPGPKSKD